MHIYMNICIYIYNTYVLNIIYIYMFPKKTELIMTCINFYLVKNRQDFNPKFQKESAKSRLGKTSSYINSGLLKPIPSMYGTFTYIYHTNQPNVGKYTIHGWSGKCSLRPLVFEPPEKCFVLMELFEDFGWVFMVMNRQKLQPDKCPQNKNDANIIGKKNGKTKT